MKTNNSSRKTKYLALLLSLLMGTSAVTLAACNGNDSSDSSSSSSSSSSVGEEEKTEEEKNYLIQNPHFATVSDDNLKYFSTSTTSWTRATNTASTGTAQTSKAASGIIDTSDKAWTSMTTNTEGIDAAKLTEAQAKEKWDTLTLKDKLAYYEAWEDANDDDDKKLSDLSFYQSVTIDGEDLPDCANPRTWDYTETTASESDYDSRVLMIHNSYDTSTAHKQGTAQKYTSSSTVTVAAGTAAQLSVWVKTSDLKCATTDNKEEGQDAVNKGAYIRITHSVGNQQLEPLEVKNINTEGVTDNNGWKQYTFYLQSSSFADATFTLVLGLGQGGGDNVMEYVNGYAFFDDIQCKTLTAAEFDTATQGLQDSQTFTLEDSEAEDKIVKANQTSDSVFALNFSGSEFAANTYLSNTFAFEYTTEKNSTGKVFTAVGDGAEGITKANGAQKPTALGFAISGQNDVAKVFVDPAAMGTSDNDFLKAAYTNYLLGADGAESKFFTGLTDKTTLMLLSANGAALTANNTQTFTVEEGKYLAISFFVKTSEMKSTAGATVSLKNGTETLATISSIDTTTATTNEAYDGWQQCFFFVEAEKNATLTLTFQLGPTTVIGTAQDAYKAGFAAFAGFKTYDFTDNSDPTDVRVLEEEFKLAAEGTYAKVVTVKDAEKENSDSFDTASAVSKDGKTIKDGYANPKNYKLYQGGAKIVRADEVAGSIDTAGLLNQKYAENYTDILNALGATGANAAEKWASVFGGGLLGTANQPLVIYNSQYATQAYGFVGSSQTISANSYQAITMRLKVSAGSKAYVYLIDTDDDSFNTKLSVSRNVTYWYDDDGNVCVSDPSASGFQDRDVALLRAANGLYTVNAAWWRTVSSEAAPTGYYANLQAYGAPVNGNLMLAEGFTAYDYEDKWQHDGNDGIAFYCYNAENKTAYADSSKTTLVNDFSALTELPARYTAEAAKDLSFEIDGTATGGAWTDVTFFVKTGATAKNYRLEIWSGSRDNTAREGAPASAFVIVDSRNIGSLDETTYSDNLSAREQDARDSFKSTFSFYDTAKFLRYNKDLDKNEVGNSYDNYTQSSYAEAVAYLKYEEGTVFETYADFSLADVTVEADSADEDEEEDEEEDATSDVNPWLLASSIVIAGVLVLTVISLVVRKLTLNARKKRRSATDKK